MSATSLSAIDADTAAADTVSVLLDVREREEWIRGHAPAAIHIPMSEFVDRVSELDPTRPIICVCRSGNRSAQVTAWLLQHDFNAVNLTGGMSSWAASGHPLVNSAGNPGLVI